jgi:hypothetical protein
MPESQRHHDAGRAPTTEAGAGVGVAAAAAVAGGATAASRGTSLAAATSGAVAPPQREGSVRPMGTPQPPHLTGPVRTAAPAEGDDDERLTWLTEDDMAWGDHGAAPPPVLGRRSDD